MIGAVWPDQLHIVWPDIEREISRVEHADWTPRDVYTALATRDAQAFIRDTSKGLVVCITRIECTWGHRYGLVWITAGDGIDECLSDFHVVIEPWFAAMGCEWIEIVGRKGWARLLPDYDSQVILRKRLI